MITLKIEPYCQNCVSFEPVTETSVDCSNGRVLEYNTLVLCKNAIICATQYKYLKRQFEKEKKEHE